jgi:dihydrodipicolinate synthase/N-acetylneuraminate lyase
VTAHREPMRLSGGIVCALTTPFGGDEKPDLEGFGALIERQIEAGIHGLFIVGTSGEGPLLNWRERLSIAEAAVSKFGGKVPIIVHCGAADTRTAESLARHAATIGADAIAVVAPYFYGWSANALYKHFRDVAGAAPEVPMYVYENPERVGYSIGADLVGRLVQEVPNIVGVKDTGDSMARLTLYLSLFDPPPDVYTGNNALVYPALKIGARGAVSALSNVVPQLFVAIYDAVMNEDDAGARRLQAIAARFQAGLRGLPYIPSLKYLLAKMGLDSGHHRRPHASLSDEQIRVLEKNISNCEGLEEWLEPAVL